MHFYGPPNKPFWLCFTIVIAGLLLSTLCVSVFTLKVGSNRNMLEVLHFHHSADKKTDLRKDGQSWNKSLLPPTEMDLTDALFLDWLSSFTVF